MRRDPNDRDTAYMIRAGVLVLALGATVTTIVEPRPGSVALRDAALERLFALHRDSAPHVARDG